MSLLLFQLMANGAWEKPISGINLRSDVKYSKNISFFCCCTLTKFFNFSLSKNFHPWNHWHIMARFETDSYFPEPMWGQKQRVAQLDLLQLFVYRQITLNTFN
jgi:hypothetical protein